MSMRLIEANDLIASLYTYEHEHGKLTAFEAQDVINSAPTIDVDRPHGEWVTFEYGDERWHKCSACGVADRYIEYVERPNGTTGKLVAIRNFCPNCGARMKGADDD